MLVDEETIQIGSDELIARVAAPDFPCLGAKSALARGMLEVLVCHSLSSG